jgi:hypothetical protein
VDELDRFISELLRIRRLIQIYSELFSEESVDALIEFSSDVFGVIQRSMHDEIVISLSRIYDGKGYDRKKVFSENLSQRNLVSKYKSILMDNEKLRNLKEETTVLLKKIDIKKYRDTKVSHNDKLTMLERIGAEKHKITFDAVVSLIEKSLDLIIGIKSEVKKMTNVSLPVNIMEKYEGKGINFICKIKKYNQTFKKTR